MNGASVVPGMRSFRPRQGPQPGRIQHRREFFGSLSLGRDRVGVCKGFIKIFLLLPSLLFALLIAQIRRVPFVEKLSKSRKNTAFSAGDSSKETFTLYRVAKCRKIKRIRSEMENNKKEEIARKNSQLFAKS